MTKEHLGVAIALGVPVFVVVTKVDLAPENVLRETLAQLQRLLKLPGARKKPFVVRSMDDVVVASRVRVLEGAAVRRGGPHAPRGVVTPASRSAKALWPPSSRCPTSRASRWTCSTASSTSCLRASAGPRTPTGAWSSSSTSTSTYLAWARSSRALS